MEDLSHWDFAEHFKAKEVAELIVGIAPEKNSNLFGISGQEAKFVATITPVLRRMERAYLSAGNILSAAATRGDPPDVSLALFPEDSANLHSEMMVRVRETQSSIGLSLFATDTPAFSEAYFERKEVSRWLAAINLPSVYRFSSSTTKPVDAADPNRSHHSPLDSAFSREFGDDREELHQWLIMDTWPVEAAMFLIAGVIPVQIYEGFGHFKVEGGLLHNENGLRDAKFNQISSLQRLWESNPQHPSRATPKYFFEWAQSKGIDISWLGEAKKAGYFAKQENTPNQAVEIHPKVQKTLLVIIAVLCKEAGLDYSKPAKTASLIQKFAEHLGIAIGETTIEGYLKKIPDALENRTK